jgi:hypothetical protein
VIGNRAVHQSETERDDIVRTFACPVCHVGPAEKCSYGRTAAGHPMTQITSHEGRYVKAARSGLVPMLVGMR